jgi:hypothetical protein
MELFTRLFYVIGCHHFLPYGIGHAIDMISHGEPAASAAHGEPSRRPTWWTTTGSLNDIHVNMKGLLKTDIDDMVPPVFMSGS